MNAVVSRLAAKLGDLDIVSAAGRVESLPGYEGPLTAADLPFALPPKRSPFLRTRAVAAADPPPDTQVDGRVIENFRVWSGLRFVLRAESLTIRAGETETIYFTTHLGADDIDGGVWTEVGIAALQDGSLLLFSYDPQQVGVEFKFHGTAVLGRDYEVAIRLNEADPGPYAYEVFVDGIRVRTGTLPSLSNQVDVSHESFFVPNGRLSPGDHVVASAGWVNAPPATARWFAADIGFTTYVSDLRKTVSLAQPPNEAAYQFQSNT